MTIIEVMPMGDIGTGSGDQYLPLSRVRASLARRFTLKDIPFRTGGPARYVTVEETGQKLGFITPLTHNFCESCNRVRVTCTGQLYMCLGQDDNADLRAALREGGPEALDASISEAIGRKPKGHDFIIDRRQSGPAVSRYECDWRLGRACRPAQMDAQPDKADGNDQGWTVGARSLPAPQLAMQRPAVSDEAARLRCTPDRQTPAPGHVLLATPLWLSENCRRYTENSSQDRQGSKPTSKARNR